MKALLIFLIVIAVIVLLLYIPVRAEISYISEKFRLRVRWLFLTVYDTDKPKKNKKKKTADVKPTDDDKASEKAEESKVGAADGGKINDDNEFIEPDGSEEYPKFEGIDIKYKKNDASESTKKTEEVKKDDKTVNGKPKRKISVFDKIRFKKEMLILGWELTKKNIYKMLHDIHIGKLFIDFTAAAEEAAEAAKLYGYLHVGLHIAIDILRNLTVTKIKKIGLNVSYTLDKPIFDISLNINIRPAVWVGNLIAAAFKLLLNFETLSAYYHNIDPEVMRARKKKLKELKRKNRRKARRKNKVKQA